MPTIITLKKGGKIRIPCFESGKLGWGCKEQKSIDSKCRFERRVKKIQLAKAAQCEKMSQNEQRMATIIDYLIGFQIDNQRGYCNLNKLLLIISGW